MATIYGQLLHALPVALYLAASLCLVSCSNAPKEAFPKVECRSPNGKRPTKIIPRWKFDRIRDVILAHVPETGEVVDFKELLVKVDGSLAEDEKKRLGKVSWLTETVTLELETRGELERIQTTRTPTPLPKKIRRKATDDPIPTDERAPGTER